MAQASSIPGTPFASSLTRLASRNIRLTVIVTVVLICGSFAAAAGLQMRNDRAHALAQARVFEAQRASDVAAIAAAAFDRMAALGRAFADGKQIDGAADGIRNITVFDRSGLALATLNSPDVTTVPPATLAAGTRAI